MLKDFCRALTIAWACAAALEARAEMRPIYHPYVQPGERELEIGLTRRGLDRSSGTTLRRLSFGYGLSDDWAIEAYVLADQAIANGRVRGFELEALWQLTEQGEYWADYGLLFEYEDQRLGFGKELSVSAVVEKELAGAWVGTLNLALEYEFDQTSADELEYGLYAQFRYLHSRAFEPAIDLALDDHDYAIGPSLISSWQLPHGRKLRLEASLPFGIGHNTPSKNARLDFELEF